MGVEEGVPGLVGGRPDAAGRLRVSIPTAAIWVVGSAVVAVAQPGSDRRLAAALSAVAAIAAILLVARTTADPGRRFLRSIVGATLTISLLSGWLLRVLGVTGSFFGAGGLVERIALPLLVVLLAPLVVSALPADLVRPRALWARRAALLRSALPLDWIVLAYLTVVAIPALLVGLAHHDRLLYVGQDLGLIVFFAFMYLAGRAVQTEAALAGAEELVGALLLLGAVQFVLLGWEPAPLYSYVEAACAGAAGVALLRPGRTNLLALGLAIMLLGADFASVLNSAKTQTSVAVEFYGAIAILGYLAVRVRRVVPQWLLVAVALVGVVGFVALTKDGAALRGQYHGADQSNLGRSYEAHQVRAATLHSPVSIVFGRGLGATIDESGASPIFRDTLVSGSRDLSHVQEIHLLAYSFLLKAGLLGVAWLIALAIGLVALVVRGLEHAARWRDPSLVVYAALPLLGFIQAQAAASHLAANPLNALGLGILATWVGARRLTPPSSS